MARIPTKLDLGRRPTAGGGVRVQVPRQDLEAAALGDVARGLGDVGQAAFAISEQRRKEQDAKSAFDRQTRLINFDTETTNAYNASTRASEEAGDDAPDFEARQLEDFDKRSSVFLGGMTDAPPEELRRMQARLQASRSLLQNNAARFESRRKKEYYSSRIDDVQSRALLDVDADPEALQEKHSEVSSYIQSSGLSDKEKRERLNALGPAMAQSSIQGLIKAGRIQEAQQLLDGFVDASDGSGATAKKVAENIPQTSMTDDVWLAQLQASRPDIYEEYQGDRNALLKLRQSDTLNQEIMDDAVESQAGILAEKGLDASPENIYLATKYGVNNVQRILDADDDDPLASVVVDDTGMTVGQVKAESQKETHKNGVTGATRIMIGPKWVAGVQQSIDLAESALVKQAGSRAQDDYQLAIQVNPSLVDQRAILSDQRLDGGQKASLLKSLDTALKDKRKRQEGALRYAQSPNSFNPYQDKDRKQLDEVFDQITGGDPERALPVAIQMVERTGIAPPKVTNAIRAGIGSTNVNEFILSAEMASDIYDTSSKAFLGQGGAKQIEDAASDWKRLTQDLQMEPKRAAEIMMQVRDPAQQQQRTILEKQAKEIIKKVNIKTIADKIDPSNNILSADVGFNDAQKQAFAGDYAELYRINYIEANGNVDLAEARTIRDMSRVYGASNLAPEGVEVVKFPAENYYPKVLGSHDYIREQAESIVKKVDPEADEIFLQATPQTRDDINAGKPPRYMIMYKTEVDGVPVMQMLPGNPLFRPELGETAEFEKMRAEKRYVTSYLDGQQVRIDRTTGTLVDDNNNPISGPDYEYIEHPLAQRGVDPGSAIRGVVVKREPGETNVERHKPTPLSKIEKEVDQDFNVEEVADSIIQAESGGDPEAMNPRSTAVGSGQFIESTWLSLIKKARPDLVKGKTRKEILDLRLDPDISREMTVEYAKDNIEKLQSKNVRVTPENVYLSHFLGPTAGVKVLKSDPSKQLSTLLPKRVLNANKFLKGRTVGWLIDWAKAKV